MLRKLFRFCWKLTMALLSLLGLSVVLRHVHRILQYEEDEALEYGPDTSPITVVIDDTPVDTPPETPTDTQ